MFKLDKFLLVHYNLCVMMTQCDEYVDYQLPNELARTNFLIDAIEYKDTGLNSDIEMVKGDKVTTVKKNELKYSTAYITLWYPVTKNRNTNRKRGAAEISNTPGGGEQFSATGEQ